MNVTTSKSDYEDTVLLEDNIKRPSSNLPEDGPELLNIFKKVQIEDYATKDAIRFLLLERVS